MSLINKMLQDLDARGTPAGPAMQLDVKPVASAAPRMPSVSPRVAVGLAACSIALGVAGVAAFAYLKSTRPAAPVPAPRAVTMVVERAPAPVAVVAAPMPVAVAVPVSVPGPVPVSVPAPEPKPAAGLVRRAPVSVPAAVAAPVSLPSSLPIAVAAPAGRVMTLPQRAERDYRAALASLQEGRVADAIGALEQAIALDPRHDAARQTLVGLLVESRRQDEAIGHLEAGLAGDPRQPSLAMLLARLQIERGGPAVDTLLRTLPYAAGNGEYHAFLAGALQRQQRHGEAAEQYQAALKGAPGNGVWLMGLGISQQADKRNAEALATFRAAKASNSLAPELQAFVERKVQQLAR